MHFYHMYLVLHFQRIQSLLHEIKSHSKAKGSPFPLFSTLLDFPSFFRHSETVQISHFFRNFFIAPKGPPINFCNRMDDQKIPNCPPFTFFGTMRLTGDLKKFRKKFGKFFSSIFSFLRAFVVSAVEKLVFESY